MAFAGMVCLIETERAEYNPFKRIDLTRMQSG